MLHIYKILLCWWEKYCQSQSDKTCRADKNFYDSLYIYIYISLQTNQYSTIQYHRSASCTWLTRVVERLTRTVGRVDVPLIIVRQLPHPCL